MTSREPVEHTIEGEGGMLFDVERSTSGRLTARFRVWGCVVVDGVAYECDRDEVRVALKRVKES